MSNSTTIIDIDQLCQLIDENKFGLKIHSTTKFISNSSFQIKIFRSSRLKRLNSSSSTTTTKSNENYSSLLIRFRSLSTMTNNVLEEELNSRRTSINSCNVEELTSYFEHFLYLPKALSSAAELMYT